MSRLGRKTRPVQPGAEGHRSAQRSWRGALAFPVHLYSGSSEMPLKVLSRGET